MRVLHVLPSINPTLGGPSHAIFPLIQSMIPYGVHSHILTTTDGIEDSADTILRDGMYKDIPITLTKPLAIKRKEFIPSADMYRWLESKITDFDLLSLHYLFTFSSSCAGFLARKKKVPYVVRTIGHCAPWSLAQQQTLKQIYLKLFDLKLLHGARGIHATTPGEKEDVLRLLPHPFVEVIPLGITISPDPGTLSIHEQFQLNQSAPVLLYLSRVHPKKRLDHLLEALKLCDLPCSLLIAGSGSEDYTNTMKAQASTLPDHIHCTFLGHVQGDLKQALLHQADLYVLPSYAENFSIATAEAMGAGLPVIIGKGVQLAPLVQQAQAGIVVEEDLPSLSNALKHLLSSSETREMMGQKGEAYVKSNLVWSEIGRQLSEFYVKSCEKQ